MPKDTHPGSFLADGKMLSFKAEKSLMDSARQQAFRAGVSLSSWLRAAAREKLTREKNLKAKAKATP